MLQPDVEFPPMRRRLKVLDRQPTTLMPGVLRTPKMPKNLIDMRGPELTHTQLLHKQYGMRVRQAYLYLLSCNYMYMTVCLYSSVLHINCCVFIQTLQTATA